MPPVLEIIVEDKRWRAGKAMRQRLEQGVAKAAKAYKKAKPKSTNANEAICLVLSNDKTVKTLNHLWRGKNKPTNVLSFEAGKGEQALGDIILAYETVAKEAELEGKRLIDHALHLAVHGYLHLVGFDHQTLKQAHEMEGLERKILLALGVADPYEGQS